MSNLGNFVWSIADQLRGVYRPNQYGSVILPMTILRRLDCILGDSRDEVRALAEQQKNSELLAVMVKAKHGLNFYNTSRWDLKKLVADPDGLAANLVDYLSRFSSNIDVFERFKFENEIANLDEKNRLLLVVKKFSEIDLHPDTVSNAEMGDLFEELIRKFAEASNETAGEHFTPRDAIRLMVDLLFAEDTDSLREPGIVRSIYDPTAGTGGMLSVAEDHLLDLNPDARLALFGQEINDQSYAICKSDMIAKGQDATNVRLGDTLANDLFYDRTFDFCLSNPPYGVDWKASEPDVKADHNRGDRFGAGLPKIGDGQMLFLQHIVSKMRPMHEGGGRAGIVLNGSPLFNGAAGSGESEIRKHLLESDLVDAIVALPTNMFYNTGISTYIWILDNTKKPERVGKVQLIDGSDFYTKMRKNLGDKSREVSESDRAKIAHLYQDFENAGKSKVLANTDFGYYTITVERPLRLRFDLTFESVDAFVQEADASTRGPLFTVNPETLRKVLTGLVGVTYMDRAEFLKDLSAQAKQHGVKYGAPQIKAIWTGLGVRDENAVECVDAKGNFEPDVSLRDSENIPFGWAEGGEDGDSEWGRDNRDALVKTYFEVEVKPHVPDAWIDESKTKVGYEIPFTRHFYVYEPPRSFDEIDADLNVLVKEIIDLLQEVEA
ncbi:class I SAM-dependent DNA methyltransferase [Mycobacterium cookii]|uniref:site-specific DNA-methyltransferase (adenine-specific) n=1 Tax=Nocardioides furvisabuli TaxID=375542 RepID=A0ABP5JAY3_9ACTN|nr:class I SAM-dependent DNA methyltransferase [Nocardioides furvisabuli]